MTDASENLIAAIKDLEKRRDDLDAAITNMRTVLVTVYGAGSTGSFTTGFRYDRPVEQSRALGRAEKVRAVFANWPEKAWDAESLLVEIGEEMTEGSLKGVHGVISRMAKAGQVEKVARGFYRSTNASAPGRSGAEEAGEPNSDSPLKEGGTDNDSAPPVGRDDRAVATHELHGHGVRRAAIGGSANL